MNRRLLGVLLLTFVLAGPLASACPMCKDSIPYTENAANAGQNSGSLPGGFNYSVYYMLGGLFLTLGVASAAIYKGIRSTSVALPLYGGVLPQTGSRHGHLLAGVGNRDF